MRSRWSTTRPATASRVRRSPTSSRATPCSPPQRFATSRRSGSACTGSPSAPSSGARRCRPRRSSTGWSRTCSTTSRPRRWRSTTGRAPIRDRGAIAVAIASCARPAASYDTSRSSTKMTKTNERLALVERQRQFEWRLAREVQTQAAARFVAGKTHDLLNLIQNVQLASLELERRCTADAGEFIADLRKAADDARHQLAELMAVARPEEIIVPGAPVGAAVTAAVETVRAASTIEVDLHLAITPEVATRCSAEELAHVIYGLTLDAATGEAEADDAPQTLERSETGDEDPDGSAGGAGGRAPRGIELFVRERTIDGKPWLEIVRGARVELAGEHFDLQAVEAIAVKNGGELGHSERRGGGTELVVALPVVTAD